MGRKGFLPFAQNELIRNGTSLPGIPLVEICNNRRVLIENHQGVAAYQAKQIRVKVRNGYISVCGDCLQLVRMSKYQLVITGTICSVCFGEK